MRSLFSMNHVCTIPEECIYDFGLTSHDIPLIGEYGQCDGEIICSIEVDSRILIYDKYPITTNRDAIYLPR